LRSLADEGKRQVGSGVVVIVATAEDGKAGIVVGVTDDLIKRFNAVDLVKKGAEALGGKGGGGRPDMAQAGGPDGSKAGEAIEAGAGALAGCPRQISRIAGGGGFVLPPPSRRSTAVNIPVASETPLFRHARGPS